MAGNGKESLSSQSEFRLWKNIDSTCGILFRLHVWVVPTTQVTAVLESAIVRLVRGRLRIDKIVFWSASTIAKGVHLLTHSPRRLALILTVEDGVDILADKNQQNAEKELTNEFFHRIPPFSSRSVSLNRK